MDTQDPANGAILDQDILFTSDNVEFVDKPSSVEDRPMRVLIVDDDLDIHAVTKLSLRGVKFKGRPLELLSAFSAVEAFEVLKRYSDIALVLLDVVMESHDAGLRLVGRIRGELDNQLVRIVLRTGQPGQAPEQQVIIDYDINDYKGKTELNKQKLFTTVITSLRAYESLLTIERSRIGLGKILEGAGNLYQIHSLREFASGVLHQVCAILDIGADGVLCVLRGGAMGSVMGGATGSDCIPNVVAATGIYGTLAENKEMPADHPHSEMITKALREKHSQFEHPIDVLFIHTQQGHDFAISVTPPWPLIGIQRELLEVFCSRIAAAFDNLYLFGQLRKAQEATVVALADLAEFRDEGTGSHVRRVQRLTEEIASKLKLKSAYQNEISTELLEMIGFASILHDVGNVSLPDDILQKPGIHTDEERIVMQTHAQIGEMILERASKMVDGTSYLTLGAEIAGGHHEHFDGGGYPRGLKGNAIPLSARIVAVVDVFDALLHRRPYKEPWPFKETVNYIRDRRGLQFDPEVVDALCAIVEHEPHDWMMGSE
jgi:response regulator RpfG family c-di-GMP phosphodiesterase